MKVSLIAVGTKMPKWVTTAYEEYQKRLPKQCSLELVEIAAKHRGKNADIPRILRDEAQAIRQALSDHQKVIVLDRKGQHITTEKLADNLQGWIDDNQDIALIIGGPEGVDPQMLAEAEQKWSLSAMTFAHPIVRVMVAEQVYRAWSIIAGLPYHRGD
ncbi:MAG: 23S rRNA (pseudouridine(1915)-N(3))-methyltransferase RlmH [Arenicella sp.]